MVKVLRKPGAKPEEVKKEVQKPEILAPAGNEASFFAAIAAGADAVYCGLKEFSARMQAKNFTIEELAGLRRLAGENNVKLYIALNSLIRPGELEKASELIFRLKETVSPDALIIQDPGIVHIAETTGFLGEIHLSTLSNVSFEKGLRAAGRLPGVRRVVLPRELHIDEIKKLADSCPPGLSLEVFVHGALCYGVSGRCYWSSFMGGKSGLRGTCVQPCRRVYSQGDDNRKKGRFFSCMDLGLDYLSKLLLDTPNLSSWKIEGRKKGPHYVYYTVSAYRMLRDHESGDPGVKRSAKELLNAALGRVTTPYGFLPQSAKHPVDTKKHTGSGLMVGKTDKRGNKITMVPRQELLPGDLLRLGYEDESTHAIAKVPKYIPKKGLYIVDSKKDSPYKGGVPVFLIDRKEQALENQLKKFRTRYHQLTEDNPGKPVFEIPAMPERSRKRNLPIEYRVRREQDWGKGQAGIWLSRNSVKNVKYRRVSQIWWWLPPIVWPDGESNFENILQHVLEKGGKRFVLNSFWQMACFEGIRDIELWAGPFCNFANPFSILVAAKKGFSGAFVSPELTMEDYLHLPRHSPLPLGIVLSGFWPLCISRIKPETIDPESPFTSPKGETAWFEQVEDNVWIYPNWKLSFSEEKEVFQKAGYSMFVHLQEQIPTRVELKKRPGRWNLDLKLD